MDACYAEFDKDQDGLLSFSEFQLICRALFRNERGKVYTLQEYQLQDIFRIFDTNNDGFIDKKEFKVQYKVIFIKTKNYIFYL